MGKLIPFSMDKRLLDYDPFTGLIQHIYYDETTNETHIETTQDAASLNAGLEMAKALKNDEDYTKKGLKDEALHYAWIPPSVIMKWLAEGMDINDKKAMIKKVNTPEYAYLKTTNLVHR